MPGKVLFAIVGSYVVVIVAFLCVLVEVSLVKKAASQQDARLLEAFKRTARTDAENYVKLKSDISALKKQVAKTERSLADVRKQLSEISRIEKQIDGRLRLEALPNPEEKLVNNASSVTYTRNVAKDISWENVAKQTKPSAISSYKHTEDKEENANG